MTRRGCRLAACFAGMCLLLFAVAVRAGGVGADIRFARDQEGIVAAVTLRMPSGAHAYAREPGDAGRPASLTFCLNGGGALPVWYPPGDMQRDFYDKNATVHVYDSGTALFVRLPGDGAGSPYEARLSLLVCTQRNCLPVELPLKGVVPVSLPDAARQSWYQDWLRLSSAQPEEGGEKSVRRFSLAGGGDARGGVAWTTVAPEMSGVLPLSGAPLPPPPGEFDFQLAPRYSAEALEITHLGKALLLGLAAGLLLNAMPCVLPVLTLKIAGLLLLGGKSNARGIRRFREHNIFFSLGIITLFTLLALFLGGADLMWGQLYQQQSVLLVLLVLIFLMGLSMLGVFTLPVIDLKAGSHCSNHRLRAYLSGFVSTFLATPCSGPLLGGVLGWAFTQPLFSIMVVFWAVGLGMALPYILFSIWPQLAQILPRPGAWMKTFERIVGFCLLGTALYLLSILPMQRHLHVLMVLLLTSFGAWLWGRFCGLNAPPLRRGLGAAAGLTLLALSLAWVLQPSPPLPRWKTFSPHEFARELGKKNLLLEFTADWCPTCKFVEASVLTDDRLRRWKTRYGMELVRVDLTAPNAFATRLCEALGSKSIPVTALFPAGEAARQPVVLRDVYTAGDLERALDQAFAGTAGTDGDGR